MNSLQKDRLAPYYKMAADCTEWSSYTWGDGGWLYLGGDNVKRS